MTAPVTTVNVALPGTTSVTATFAVTIERGRFSPLFATFDPATVEVSANNEDRDFDPLHAGGPYYGDLIPGREASIVSGGVTIFAGYVADWNHSYDRSLLSNAYCRLEDFLGRLGRIELDEWTTTNGQLPGARLESVFERPEVTAELFLLDEDGDPIQDEDEDYLLADGTALTVSFDDGIFVLGADVVAWGSNALNYCQLVAQSDDGYFFVNREGTLCFYDRHHFINATPAATLGTGGIGFSAIATSYGNDLLYNRVLVDRVDGVEQSVFDLSSISSYGGTYTLRQSGLLLQDDIQVLDLANYLLSVYKDPLYRIEQVTVDVHGLTAPNQATVLALDIGSVVTVAFTPNGVGSAISRTCVVEGVRHTIAPAVHVMELTLNDSATVQTGGYWTVEDATYGTFDGSGVLSYPVAF